jgi:hypothetical protein
MLPTWKSGRSRKPAPVGEEFVLLPNTDADGCA